MRRIRQGIFVILAWGRAPQDNLARQYLTPSEYSLFLKMPRADRHHHLRVLQDLLRAGHTHPSLLKAALLHDVGKTRFRFSLPEKTMVVLVKAFAPQRFATWCQSEPRGWKRPFVVSAQHPAWSAELGEAVGLDPLSIDLIRRHQINLNGTAEDTESDRLLLLLQAADDRS